MKINLKQQTEYLESRVGIDVYVWGGNGETIIILMPKLCNMEKDDHTDKQALENTDRVLTLLQKRLLQGISIFEIRGEDCSGLLVKFLMDIGFIKYDMTANSLYKFVLEHGKEVSIKDVQEGDYLFQGNSERKWHVGCAVSNKYAVESKNHDEGVCKTSIASRNWDYCVRPNWYEDGPEPVPEKPVLKRELYYAKDDEGRIVIRGEDVKEAQLLLIDKGYNPGEADGIFGNNTSIATKNFQSDNDLTVDGIIGKNTATKLGFKWEG